MQKASVTNGAVNGHATDPKLAHLRSSGATDLRRGNDSPTSWDEYPNGRFGDARSPAYGDLDGWGVSLKLTPSEALRQWGTPVEYADISQLSVRYLPGSLSAIPWSDEPLRSETSPILPRLVDLDTEKNWRTAGS